MTLPAGAANAQLNLLALTDAAGNILGTAGNPLRMATTPGALVAAVTAGTAVTAASETSLLPTAAKYTFAPNSIKVGSVFRVTASGILSSVITTPGTARFKLKLGPTANIAVFDGLAVLLDAAQAHVNDAFFLSLLVTCRAVGSSTSANLWGTGRFDCNAVDGIGTMPLGCTPAMLPWAQSSQTVGTGFDSTVANILDLTFTQTVATGSITLEQYVVEQLQ